ncbi:hypothetical protein [Rickettsia endosymbiont of Orchestes rusci]|uniref:hypothetical protein n=1 Tax=Rickettsia endosymbiont of Orchestes rusci TaxID=3066250 RepID=UPI00313BF080
MSVLFKRINKTALGVAIQKIIVILNLFQDLLQGMLKQVQHDKEKSRFPPARE